MRHLRRPAARGGNHKGSAGMRAQIDTICKAEGVYPHAVLSGHAHNYQRYLRTIKLGSAEIEVPFIVCGDSEHNVNRLVKGKRGQPATEPHFGDDVSYLDQKPVVSAKGLRLKHYDDSNYGYLRVTVDKKQLHIGFHEVGKSVPQSRVDMVTVDLASRRIVARR
jgi:hypothetical protein